MTFQLRSILLLLVAILGIAHVAGAQAPKVGDYYEDDTDLGFKVKMPKDWDFIPPEATDGNLIGKYSPPFNKYINIGPGPNQVLWLDAYLIKFDRRKEAEAESTKDAIRQASKAENLMDWVKDQIRQGNGYRVQEEKEQKIDKVPSVEYLIVGTREGIEFYVYAMLYKLREDVDVAAVFIGPADKKKWGKYESVFKKMAKSFKTVEVKELKTVAAVAGESPLRTQKRAQLHADAARTPGWVVHETPHYFILTNSDDREFVTEVKERLEAYRALFDEVVPFDEAERLWLEGRKKRAEEAKAAGEGSEEGEEGEAGEDGLQTKAATYLPRDRAVCSVVRICGKESEYKEYGGPPNSAGYWWSVTEELVLYDAQMSGGRGQTFGTLAHEAFHQYIHYLYGGLAPHDWYNEGTADFFGGYEYKHKRLKLERNERRIMRIQELIKAGEHVPIDRLIKFTHAEYYGQNDLGRSQGDCYAQGWSFVYFLRTGKKACPDWNDAWDDILDTYYKVLASTSDLDTAIDAAFAGVDLAEMERVWKDFVLKKA